MEVRNWLECVVATFSVNLHLVNQSLGAPGSDLDEVWLVDVDLWVVAQWPGPHLPSSLEFELVPTMQWWPRVPRLDHTLSIIPSIVYWDHIQVVLVSGKSNRPADVRPEPSQTVQLSYFAICLAPGGRKR